MSTELPRPPGHISCQPGQERHLAIAASAAAGVTGGMGRTLLPEYLRNKRFIFGH